MPVEDTHQVSVEGYEEWNLQQDPSMSTMLSSLESPCQPALASHVSQLTGLTPNNNVNAWAGGRHHLPSPMCSTAPGNGY